MQTDVNGIMLVPLSELQLWERNYRRGNVEAVKASIQRFGFRRPLSVWHGNVVMAGNHTLKALREMESAGMTVPCRLTADPVGDWLIPCVDVSDLTEEEAKAYAIADNATADLATNDGAALDVLLDEIMEDDPELLDVLAKMGIGDSTLDIDGPKKPEASRDQEEEETPIKCPNCGHMFVPE